MIVKLMNGRRKLLKLVSYIPFVITIGPLLTWLQGYAKADYAVGYFTEMGIGCRRDPREAHAWYLRAVNQGDDCAKQRLAIIRSAESASLQPGLKHEKLLRKTKSMIGGDKAEERDCVVM